MTLIRINTYQMSPQIPPIREEASVTDQFLLGPALHHLDADASRREDEPDPEISDAAWRRRLQSLRPQLADLRIDVRHCPAEVIDRVALARRGLVALVCKQQDRRIRIFHRIDVSLPLDALAAVVFEEPLQFGVGIRHPEVDMMEPQRLRIL